MKLKSILAAAVFAGMVATALPAAAQGRAGISWSGNIDANTVIYIQGNSVSTQVRRGQGPTGVSYHFFGRLPNRPVLVSLANWDGRGIVRILQQPGPDNGFTAAVQIRDPQPGRGHYDFDLRWDGGFGGGYHGGPGSWQR